MSTCPHGGERATHGPRCTRNHWPHDACEPRPIRWRLYGLSGGYLTARPVDRPVTAARVNVAHASPAAIVLEAPRPELPRSAVVLLEYRDAPDARRSARYDAAAAWALRTFDA